jgi:hypothetical protein
MKHVCDTFRSKPNSESAGLRRGGAPYRCRTGTSSRGLHVGTEHVLPSQILVKLRPMTDEDDRRLRETVLAELKRRRHLAGEDADRPTEDDADDADDAD